MLAGDPYVEPTNEHTQCYCSVIMRKCIDQFVWPYKPLSSNKQDIDIYPKSHPQKSGLSDCILNKHCYTFIF